MKSQFLTKKCTIVKELFNIFLQILCTVSNLRTLTYDYVLLLTTSMWRLLVYILISEHFFLNDLIGKKKMQEDIGTHKNLLHEKENYYRVLKCKYSFIANYHQNLSASLVFLTTFFLPHEICTDVMQLFGKQGFKY